MKKYFKLMRMHHYIKNLLVFAAIICSGQLFDAEKFVHCLLGFIAFCAVASVIYIINDLKDVEKDRNHPTKCKRPIASGQISEGKAKILASVILVFAIATSILLFDFKAMLLLLAYLILNLGYSFGLKDIPMVDIIILVSGFLIRVLFGAVITQIEISNWLYLTVIAMSFYLALGKRRNELKRICGDSTRKVLKEYSVEFLDKNMGMCLTLANVFYALWSMDEKTATHYNSQYLIFTVPIVLIITMKYSLNIEGNSDGDPVEVILKDKVLISLCFVYALVMMAVLYL